MRALWADKISFRDSWIRTAQDYEAPEPEINPARMEWDDSDPMLWDDDTEMEWDAA